MEKAAVTVTSVKTNERKKWLTIAAGMLEVVQGWHLIEVPLYYTGLNTRPLGNARGGVHLQYRKDAHLANFLPRQKQAL